MKLNLIICVVVFYILSFSIKAKGQEDIPTLSARKTLLCIDSSGYVDSIHFVFKIKGDLPLFYIAVRCSSMGSYVSCLASEKFIPHFEEKWIKKKIELYRKEYPHGIVLFKIRAGLYTAKLPFRGYNIKFKEMGDVLLIPYYDEVTEGNSIEILKKEMFIKKYERD